MKARPLHVELLEDRCVPVTWGNPWPDAMNLTLSFAPDGTLVSTQGGTSASDLHDALGSSQSWQLAILKAFQTWAVNANINIGLVADSGQQFGTGGLPQGDSRFGDIRIGGIALAEHLAIASPFEATAGTWAGDVLVNTSRNFSADYDLFSVLLHEAGHTFGLDHNPDLSSPLYPTYQGVRTGLTASDIANLQALYGARTADQYEGTTGNNTLSSASRLSLLTNSNGALGLAVDGDIQSLTDRDVFRFQAPLNIGPMVINLKTAGLSLLGARVTVYDSYNRVVATTSSTDPFNNDLTLRIASPTPLGTYSIKIESATEDVFGIGSYHLDVSSIPVVRGLTGLLGSVTNVINPVVDALPLNNSFLTASLLPPLTTQVSSRFDYAYRSNLSGGWDVNYYRLTAPQAIPGKETVLTAMVWGTGNNGLKPMVSVYDGNQNLVTAEVLVNADGVFTVQVRNAVAGATYFVKVQTLDAQGENTTGNYFLGVDFSTQPVVLQTVVSDTLNAAKPSESGTLTVNQSEMMHLVLEARGAAATVRMTVTDLQGNVIAVLEAISNKPAVSLTNGLTAGRYVIRFEAFTTDGSPLKDVHFTLKASRVSDPLGPRNEDATAAPAGSPSSPPPSSPPPSDSPPPSPTPEEEYYYEQYWFYYTDDEPTPGDPPSNPYGTN